MYLTVPCHYETEQFAGLLKYPMKVEIVCDNTQAIQVHCWQEVKCSLSQFRTAINARFLVCSFLNLNLQGNRSL